MTMAVARHRRRSGAVMVEFVFCLPLLGFVIAMIFFFGWAMANQQHVKMAARDAVWRNVCGTGDATATELNSGFFNNQAGLNSIQITVSDDVWPDGLKTEYQNQQAQMPPAAKQLSNGMIVNLFPKGVKFGVSAEFPSSVGAWQRFTGAIGGQSARDGLEWRRGQAEWNEAVEELFLSKVDTMLGQIPAPGDGLGQMVRQLYMSHW